MLGDWSHQSACRSGRLWWVAMPYWLPIAQPYDLYPYFRTTDGKDGGFLRLLLIIPLIGILIFGALYLFLRAPLVHFFLHLRAEG